MYRSSAIRCSGADVKVEQSTDGIGEDRGFIEATGPAATAVAPVPTARLVLSTAVVTIYLIGFVSKMYNPFSETTRL